MSASATIAQGQINFPATCQPVSEWAGRLLVERIQHVIGCSCHAGGR